MAFVGKLLKPLRGALQLNQMKLYNLHKKQNLPITVDEAWAFLSSPKNQRNLLHKLFAILMANQKIN